MSKEGYLLQKGFGCAQQTGVLVQLGVQEEGAFVTEKMHGGL